MVKWINHAETAQRKEIKKGARTRSKKQGKVVIFHLWAMNGTRGLMSRKYKDSQEDNHELKPAYLAHSATEASERRKERIIFTASFVVVDSSSTISMPKQVFEGNQVIKEDETINSEYMLTKQEIKRFRGPWSTIMNWMIRTTAAPALLFAAWSSRIFILSCNNACRFLIASPRREAFSIKQKGVTSWRFVMSVNALNPNKCVF